MLKIALLMICFVLNACLKQADTTPTQKVSYSKLEIYPSLQTLSSGGSQIFYGINGIPPYTYSVSVGGGSIDSASGLYTSSTTTGTAVIKVVDSLGQEAISLVFIVDQLQLSPTSVNVTSEGTLAFSTTGGNPPYTYSVSLGGGSIGSLTGLFTAPTTPGTSIVEVTDKNGSKLTSVVTIVDKPHISPSTSIVEVKEEVQFQTLGGTEPYTYSVYSGSGSINSVTGLYTAPSSTGNAVIQVRDKYGFNSYSQMQIIISKKIEASTSSICANIGSIGGVKCWGKNDFGQLGIASTANVGDKPYQMGVSLKAVVFGYSNISVSDISSGNEHFCALMQNGDIKCWGYNAYGQIGMGDTVNRGDIQDISSVPPIDFGVTLLKPQLVTSGANHNCTVFDNNAVKCWGRNNYGQLGLGDTNNRGDIANEMGTFLNYVDLGTIDTIKTIRSNGDHTCVLTSTSKVKCWGRNDFGQLGLGDNNHRGDAANEMGNNLPFLDFGNLTGITIIDITVGSNHTCALFSNGKAKCWGSNTYGQLGLGDILPRGTSPSQTPANLPYIDLGSFSTKTLISGFNQTCAINASGDIKCWGRNSSSQLGQLAGPNIGINVGDMGTTLSNIDLGSAAKVRRAALGDEFTCVVLTDGRVKCFGSNLYGQIGLERNTSPYDIIGDIIGEMGNYLSPVDL